ncbi:nucleoside diphosphate-linked moiety X motif 17-like [Hyperolius riggenbachi]|uniref:nucleoside diphosphate-linked moiety X motif 17-like n=1 Tax=Hyperolius riggenbachi TaxID=752182 RepID=UPI0035A2BFAB
MEPGENLLECGLRELWEETHLDLRSKTPPWRIVGLWETAYPVSLNKGLPIRHYIAAILLVTSSHTHQELQAQIRLDDQVVSACTWLDPEMTEGIVGAQQGVEDSGKKLTPFPALVRITEMSGNSLHQKDTDASIFLNAAAVDGDDAEYISIGTRYALEIGLQTLQSLHPF